MSENMVAELHRTLVDALRKSRPNSLHRPVTVAEIYQDLVPYKIARGAVGFEMNADYEHTLLRLLAGEGDLARIEPREVRDKLRLELDSPNPDVSLYRNYAACDVWVSVAGAQPGVDEDEEEEASWEEEFVGPADDDIADPADIQAALFAVNDEEDEDEDEEVLEDEEENVFEAYAEAEVDEIAEDDDVEIDKPVFQLAQEEAVIPAEEPQDIACAFCGSDLPHDRMVNFCPFCGSDQAQQPCPSCGEMLDPLWRFCIACGTRVRQLGDHVN
ncbi:MAG TPA: zinc ribbon domain-containing protein [Longimicrobiales bacterium]|nr:zinc ribbon domain-containing protein [Longimicrobiales bacterium]